MTTLMQTRSLGPRGRSVVQDAASFNIDDIVFPLAFYSLAMRTQDLVSAEVVSMNVVAEDGTKLMLPRFVRRPPSSFWICFNIHVAEQVQQEREEEEP